MIKSFLSGARLKLGHTALCMIWALLLDRCDGFLRPQTAPVLKPQDIRSTINSASYLPLFANADNAGDENETHRGRIRNLQLIDTDVMPRREQGAFDHSISRNYELQDWGIEKHENPLPDFPDSIQSVADDAFRAIVGTWDSSCCLDPSQVSNAMAKNTVFDYRPVRQNHDRGRIGIEIAGANLLRNDQQDGLGLATHSGSNGGGLRHLILVLAVKLSQYTSELAANSNTTKSDQQSYSTPVAVYFNTVKQALAATRQLQFLKHQSESLFSNITIHCLGQDDDIPLSMKTMTVPPNAKTGRARKKKVSTTGNGMDPTRGVVVVVRPTDFNEEYKPPGPAIGVLPSFQKLVARASAEEVPVVMVSPRFHISSSGSGWAQTSGGHQAAIYGGLEPPRGPTPWILRDFNPPVYCWVGNAVSLEGSQRGHQPHVTDKGQNQYLSMALTQSVMDEGHPWHIFAARLCNTERRHNKLPYDYEYLASTKSSQGRPTRDIMRHILSEFGSD